MIQIKGAFLNDKGNPTALRNTMKVEAMSSLKAKLGLADAANGGAYREVAEDENGVAIYAVYTVTITHKDPTVATATKAKAEKPEVELPDSLF